MSTDCIKQKNIIELPAEAVGKRYIVLKLKESAVNDWELPYAYTDIQRGQWEYTLPYDKKDVEDVQFNDTMYYHHKLEVKCACCKK